MKEKYQFLVLGLIIFSIVLSIFLIIFFFNSIHRPSEPPFKIPPLIHIEKNYITSRDLNLSQSRSVIVNLNVSSRAEKELVIPFSLELYSVFRDGVQDVNPEVSGYEYRYEPSFIVIEPNGWNSTLLTVEFFDIFDIDRYDFRIKPSNVDEHHLGGYGHNIDVISR